MSGGQWIAIDSPAAATAAVAVKAAPAVVQGAVIRCRSLVVSVVAVGSNSGPITAVLRDGATAVGAPLWSAVLQAPQNAGDSIVMTGIDYRASLGNALTLDVSAAAGTGLVVGAMSGDIVANGYNMGTD